MSKEYKTIKEQIEELKNKGIKFKNENNAKKIILRENYYHLINYDEVFINLKKNNYEEETYFEELYAIYNFDRELKNLIFDYINIVETNIKSLIAYEITEKKEKNLLNKENFNTNSYLNDKYEILKKQIEDNLQRSINENNNNLKKYKEKFNDLPPLLLIQSFTFGNIKALYSMLKPEIKDNIATNLSIDNKELENNLKILNIVRNICAHGDILFNLKLNKNILIKDDKYYKLLKIPKENNKYIYGTNDLLSIIMILKNLLNKNNFYNLCIKIENLLIYTKNELDDLSYHNLLKIMGIPNNFNLLYTIDDLKNITYNPTPIDTSDISLNEEYLSLADIIAENNHNIWGLERKKGGWQYGTIRDDELKTNPCLIPYKNLSKTEKEFDYKTAIETIKLIQKLGYKIKKENE